MISFFDYDALHLLCSIPSLLVGLAILHILRRYISWILTPLRNVPGPQLNSFLWGYIPLIQKEPFLAPHKRWWKEVGPDAPMMHYTGVLGSSSVVVLDKNIIKEILTAPNGINHPRFVKISGFLGNSIGNGLIAMEGTDWVTHRHIIQPAFHVQFLKEVLVESVPKRVQQLIQSWNLATTTISAPSCEIDLSSHLSALTLDIIGDVAFSHNFHGLRSVRKWAERISSNNKVYADKNHNNKQLEPVNDPFIENILGVFQFTTLSTLFFNLGSPWLDRHANPQKKRCRKLLDGAVDNILNNVRYLNSLRQQQEKDRTNGSSSLKTNSLLRLLLQANDNTNTITTVKNGKQRTLSTQELRDEAKTFILAGHETTATLCNFAIYALIRHPTVQERLYQEIRSIDINSDRMDLLKSIDEMEYFNAFLNEVARLYPPVGMMIRTNQFDERFAGYKVPRKTKIILPIHLLHRHPKYWQSPEEFQPERWIHTSTEQREEFLKQTRFAYIPFSAGGRNCIGKRFALIEAKLILVSLVQAFEFQPAPSQTDTKFTFTNYLTTRLKPGFKVCVQSRT